ncbi:MAG: hypothetical protein JW810_11775 [Sedimentisphaerales bacterium]|nr:hypothetical protein [Sedimentisphaerales bacterium]
MKRVEIYGGPLRGGVLILLAAALALAGGAAPAQGQPYAIDWYTVDGGGEVSTSSDYELVGTIGQPDAGGMAGGNYILAGGFWSGQIPCFVNLVDLERFVSYWLVGPAAGIPADFNSDSKVDLLDYNILCRYWMQYCPSNWPDW